MWKAPAAQALHCTAEQYCSTSHSRGRWEFRDLCFVLDETEAEEWKKECSLPSLPAFFAKDSRLLDFSFFFLATKSQVGGRQREKLVANGE